MIKPIKTIFIGTPDFAVQSLEALLSDAYFDVLAVITKPDVKVGRQQILTAPPVKITAQKFNKPVWQPAKINDCLPNIIDLQPDLIIVTAYAQIIPSSILDLPRYGCINVHASLLPKYRGSSCIQAAILNGDKTTGITIMKMDKNLDTGAIIAQSEINIADDDTGGTLFIKLAQTAATLLTTTLKKYIKYGLKSQPQNNTLASNCKIINKIDGQIDWLKPAAELEKFIRAMNPWPGAFTTIRDLKVKIIATNHSPLPQKRCHIGELFLYDDQLAIQCVDAALVIKEIQPENKKVLNAKSFANGYSKYINI